ncbi:acyl carrier protein [Mycobacterium sp. URHD0025]|uniref:acyl carrier protein n=1 Tax=Mycobacterium sp. URHD0025 TaxID=1298864 RepID=UPI00048BA5B1|nr:acyl carrier protein [Mycobacterium sp. URHD0025]
MAECARGRLLDALSEVLYADESDFVDGDATDLRDLGLDSVRFVLLMKKLGIDRESDVPRRLAENLSLGGWLQELETLNEPV